MALSLNATSQVAKCRNAIVILSSLGNGSITATGINYGSTDYVSLSVSPSTFDCSKVGPNVVVLDSTKPLAKCKTVSVNIQSDTTLSPSLVDNGSSDACGILEYTLTPNQFNCSNVGNNLVTLKVKDKNGNMSTCPATIIITCNN